MCKELWLCARRGTIDDFAKQYGTYEENLKDGTVKNQKEYEDYWKSEFPDEVEWYRFVAVEHTDIKYRCVFLSNKQVLEMDKRLESGYTHDISEFTEWLVDAVKLTIEAVRNGTYTIFVEFPIWWYIAPTIVNAFLESYDLTGKTIIPFATSGGSGMGKTNEALKPSCTGATLLEGKVWKSTAKKEELSVWADSLACR